MGSCQHTHANIVSICRGMKHSMHNSDLPQATTAAKFQADVRSPLGTTNSWRREMGQEEEKLHVDQEPNISES